MVSITDLFCRLCLTTCVDNMELIFNNEHNLAEKIQNITSIEINDLKGLPRYVCIICTEKLFSALKFKKLCIQSNETLMNKYAQALEFDDEQYSKDKNLEILIDNKSNLEMYEDTETQLEKIIYASNKPNSFQEEIVDIQDKEMKINARQPSDKQNESLITNPDIEKEKIKIFNISLPIEKTIKTIIRNEIIPKELNQNNDNSINKVNLRKSITADKSKQEKVLRVGQRVKKVCPICGKMFSDLPQHIRTHTGEKFYRCPHCKKEFAQIGNLKSHINIHTGDKPFHCKLCDRKFATTNYLRSHMVTHTGERKYHCKICDKKFGYHYVLSQHIKSHTQEKNYSCSLCQKSFINKQGLIKHTRIHTGEKPYKCKYCTKSFTSSGNLSTHRRIHEKPYKCEYCTKSFTSSVNLSTHQRIHEKPYECTVCKMDFAYRNVLKSHMVTHTLNDTKEEDKNIEFLISKDYFEIE